MPTYGYRCKKGHEFEIVQGIREDPLTRCQVCKSPVQRIFYPVGIVFKGPGFYKTDSRGSSSSSSVAPGSAKEGGGTSDSESASKSTSSTDKGTEGGDKSTTSSEPKKSPKKDASPPVKGGTTKSS